MKYYNETHYVPVNTYNFDTIEINIKNDTVQNVTFKARKVICKLHFRQKGFKNFKDLPGFQRYKYVILKLHWFFFGSIG